MSRTEGGKFFQPIPLSAILDPTYQTPYTKGQQYQVSMEKSKMCLNQQHSPSLWRKLQSSLMGAMSNLVIMSHPVVATSLTNRSASMSLLPFKPWKPCDFFCSSESETDFSKSSTPQKSIPEATSLYYSIRSGLQCLRYFATHPVSCEELKKDTSERNCKENYINSSSNSTFGYYFMGGALSFPASESCKYSTALSAPTTPLHRCSQARDTPPNFFSLAMRGLLISCPQYLHRINSFYNNFGFFPLNVKGGQTSMSTPTSPQKIVNLELSGSFNPAAIGPTGSNIEIIIHSTSSSQDQDRSNSVTSPSKPNISDTNGNPSESCIRIETSWRPKNGKSKPQEEAGVANFCAMSMCSTSAGLNAGTFTFSCSSTLSSSPKNMAAGGTGRRRKTESESSTDSFIEFSASVESTDSFCIVFEPAGDSIDEEAGSRADEDEEWEDADTCSDDSDDDEDQIFNYGAVDDLTDGDIFQADGFGDQVDFSFQPNLVKKKKTVSFDEDHLVNVIEFEDDSDSKGSRETYWEMLARDRARFKDRIERTGDILEHVLQPGHRSKIFQQRFLSKD